MTHLIKRFLIHSVPDRETIHTPSPRQIPSSEGCPQGGVGLRNSTVSNKIIDTFQRRRYANLQGYCHEATAARPKNLAVVGIGSQPTPTTDLETDLTSSEAIGIMP